MVHRKFKTPYSFQHCFFMNILKTHICWLKKYSHNLKVELFYLVEMLRTPSQETAYLSSSEKTAPRRQEGESGYIQVCKKGSGSLNIKDQISS